MPPDMPSPYEQGRIVGQILTELRAMRRETDERHRDNLRIATEQKVRIDAIEKRVNILWQWKYAIVAAMAGAGIVAHFASDMLTSISLALHL